ncbi:MAG: hypothetical protein JWM89_30 [Acidimicrobiales bacterium]|nr:hypothetical protein [Acidimicrobiales bacterium]
MTIDPDRLADLLARKLAALVRTRWPDLPDTAMRGSFPGGASVVDAEGDRAWISLSAESDAERRLGAALAVARRAGARELHVVVDGDAAPVLARRATLFADPPTVWRSDGVELTRAVAAPPAVDPAPAPEAELYRPLLVAAGLEAVVEGGNLIGEYLGLEVARVVVDDGGGAHIEAGVGRFDREAGALMFADLGETDALARVVELVSRHRNATAERHPINQLVPERWLRTALIAEPGRVGAASLEAVPSALARRNLLEIGVASARGVDLDGRPLIVTCSTGVDLDLVPAAADDRLAHDPDARLVLAVPGRDAVPVTTELASRLILPATVVAVEDGWTSIASGRP